MATPGTKKIHTMNEFLELIEILESGRLNRDALASLKAKFKAKYCKPPLAPEQQQQQQQTQTPAT